MKRADTRNRLGTLLHRAFALLWVWSLTWTLTCPPAFAAQGGQGPEHAVHGMQRALESGDAALLDKWADVDGILGQAVDVFLEDARTPEGQALLPPMLAVVLSSVDSSPQAKALVRGTLQKEAGEFVRYGVRSGKFAGKPREAAPPSGMLAPLFADASLGRKEILSIGRAVPEGSGYYVPFVVRDHGNGNTYPIEATVHKKGDQWRIAGIRNMRALMDRIRQEAVE